MNRLIKYRNLYKDASKKIPFNDVQPTIRVSDNYPNLSSMYLDCDDIVKSVVVKYEGTIISIPPMHTEGFYVKHGNNKIRLINFNKNPLRNGILLKFVGSITKITFAEVYFWGGAKTKGIKFERSDNRISKNDNIVSGNSIIIEDEETTRDRSIVFTNNNDIIKNNINFLYTSGWRFLIDGKFYVGHYHYDTRRKLYRTKGYSMAESRNLKPTEVKIKNRRQYGI